MINRVVNLVGNKLDTTLYSEIVERRHFRIAQGSARRIMRGIY